MNDPVLQAIHQTSEFLQQDIRTFFEEYIPEVKDNDPWSERLIEAIYEYCLREGKALRPFLVMCGAAMSQGVEFSTALQDPRARRLALIVHFHHKRLLMADDIADQDEMRNGAPSFHVKMESDLRLLPNYSQQTPEFLRHIARSYTEVSGIWLHEITHHLIQRDELFTHEEQLRIIDILRVHTYEKTVAGWITLLDQNFEPLTEKVSEERFLRGLELVTSEYSCVSPLLLGASLGEKFTELTPSIKAFAEPTGVLYQLTDDFIGLFGDTSETGKSVGGDVREGKKTLYMQYAYQEANDTDKQKLQQLVGNQAITEAEMEWVRHLVKNTPAFDRVSAKITEYSQQCLQAAQALPAPGAQMLTTLISMISQRKK